MLLLFLFIVLVSSAASCGTQTEKLVKSYLQKHLQEEVSLGGFQITTEKGDFSVWLDNGRIKGLKNIITVGQRRNSAQELSYFVMFKAVYSEYDTYVLTENSKTYTGIWKSQCSLFTSDVKLHINAESRVEQIDFSFGDISGFGFGEVGRMPKKRVHYKNLRKAINEEVEYSIAKEFERIYKGHRVVTV